MPPRRAVEPPDDPAFTPKEVRRLRDMKWLQAVGLQYNSTAEDGAEKSSQKENLLGNLDDPVEDW